MAIDAEDYYYHHTIVYLWKGELVAQDLVICNPGAWPEIKAGIGDTEGWLEIRHGDRLAVLGIPTPTTIERAVKLLRLGDVLAAPADDDRAL